MTYGGHRVHPRRRMAAAQAAPVPAVVEAADALDDPGPAAAPRPSSNLDEGPAEGAGPGEAATFVRALAYAMHDVAPEDHSPAQLARLRAVLAVAAPAVVLTTTDPDLQEPPVPTTTTARPSGKLPEGPPPEPEVDRGQGSELAGLLAELVAERAETAAVLAQRDALLAEAGDPQRIAAAEVATIAAARQQAEDEAAIADLRQRVETAQHLTAVATAHLIVSVAALALVSVGLPATERDALALTAAVPVDVLVVAVGGRVDVEAARAALTAAAAQAGTR